MDMVLARTAGIPLCITLRNSPRREGDLQLEESVRSADTDVVGTTCRTMREGIPAERLAMIYNGVILPEFVSVEKRGPVIGNVADGGQLKGQAELIRASAILPGAELLIVGRTNGKSRPSGETGNPPPPEGGPPTRFRLMKWRQVASVTTRPTPFGPARQPS